EWLNSIEIVGGHPVVDFINTVHSRTESTPRDYLETPSHLIGWCLHMHLIDQAAATQLLRLPETGSRELLEEARALRETLYAVLREHLDDSRRRAALDRLNHALREMVSWRRLEATAAGFTWRYRVTAKHPRSLFAPLIFEATALLQSPDLARLKTCPPPEGCGWLFIDRSRNGSRTWCNMKTCGNLAKQHRYRARKN